MEVLPIVGGSKEAVKEPQVVETNLHKRYTQGMVRVIL